MTVFERRAAVTALQETLAVHDDAALTLMKAAQKHLRAARQVNGRLDELQRPRHGTAAAAKHLSFGSAMSGIGRMRAPFVALGQNATDQKSDIPCRAEQEHEKERMQHESQPVHGDKNAPAGSNPVMALRCKLGDMALVISGRPNVGKLVTCLELLPAGSWNIEKAIGPLWRVDRPIAYGLAGGDLMEVNAAPDGVLMPIRPPHGVVR